jgi:hypothetical protein
MVQGRKKEGKKGVSDFILTQCLCTRLVHFMIGSNHFYLFFLSLHKLNHKKIKTHTNNLFGSLSFPGTYTLSVNGIITSFPSDDGDNSDIALDDAVRRAAAARS